MTKASKRTGSPVRRESTSAAARKLPDDPQTLRQMLDGLNDFIDRFRAAYDDNPLDAYRGVAGLLDDIIGNPSESASTATMEVKPGFHVAARFVDLDAVCRCLEKLREAIKDRRDYISELEVRLWMFLDENSEEAHYRNQHEHEGRLTREVESCYAQLVEFFVGVRNEILEKLAMEQTAVSDPDQQQNNYATEPPPEDSGFDHGPVQGRLNEIARWLGMDLRTVKAQHRRGGLWLYRIHRDRWEVFFRNEQRFRKVRNRSLGITETA